MKDRLTAVDNKERKITMILMLDFLHESQGI